MKMTVAIALAALLAGCGSEGDPAKTTQKTYAAVDGARVSKTWPARMANDQVRSRFEGGEGWRAIFESESRAIVAFGRKTPGTRSRHQVCRSHRRQRAPPRMPQWRHTVWTA